MLCNILKMFGVSLALTLLFEFVFVWLAGLRGRKVWLFVFLVNVLTNPCAVLSAWLARLCITTNCGVRIPGIQNLLAGGGAAEWKAAVLYGVCILLIEAVVVVTEGILYDKALFSADRVLWKREGFWKRRFTEKSRPYLFALAVNAFSYGAGELLQVLRL